MRQVSFDSATGAVEYVTTVCDVANRRIIDVIDSRQLQAVCQYFQTWPAAQRAQVHYGTLDMSSVYRKVFTTMFPQAIKVADHFHVISLANRMVDEIRRRRQQEIHGHRGQKHDPLYTIRRLLLYGEQRLVFRDCNPVTWSADSW